MPDEQKETYWRLKDTDRTRGKKAHWIKSAYALGFRNVDDNRSGILYCPEVSTIDNYDDTDRDVVEMEDAASIADSSSDDGNEDVDNEDDEMVDYI